MPAKSPEVHLSRVFKLPPLRGVKRKPLLWGLCFDNFGASLKKTKTKNTVQLHLPVAVPELPLPVAGHEFHSAAWRDFTGAFQRFHVDGVGTKQRNIQGFCWELL